MYRALGTFVSRHWIAILVVWIVATVGLHSIAPDWKSIIHGGEFTFLPEGIPSRDGEELFRKSFSHDFLGSNVVVVVRRLSGKEGLLPQDRDFIDRVLKPRIERIAAEAGGIDEEAVDIGDGDFRTPAKARERALKGRSVITAVRTYSDSAIGHLLDSDDGKASLVMVNLRTELFAHENRPTIEKIERLIARDGDLRSEGGLIPPGLDLAISGSATVGRDMHDAETASAKATEFWTVFLVVALLLLIYRSPLLAFIPLVTVVIAVHLALVALSLMAQAEWIHPFAGIDVYITVVMYGAGVDYCVFLMARYKEELDAGLPIDEAIQSSITKVGAALVASAGTTMAGIGMMVFCQFGKFQQAGAAMSMSLVFVLAASMTFAPALMLLFGRWAFWPNIRNERIPARAGWLSPTRFVTRILEHDLVTRFWERVGLWLVRRPGTIFFGSIALMAPFALNAVVNSENLSYGLMSELPSDVPCVIGSRAVQDHYSPGITGPVTVLLQNREWDFRQREATEAIRGLTANLAERRDELKLDDVRSLSHPLGVTEAAERAEARNQEEMDSLPVSRRLVEAGVRRKKILEHYVSDRGPMAGQVTRLDVVFHDDPFSRDSIRRLERFSETIRYCLPESLRSGTELHFIGATPSIRDLKQVTGQDQLLINILVIISVFFVLVALLRKVAIAGYLIVSVYFSYLVALGVTFSLFQLADWDGFSGLDWKVPIFLFTILIAVGEDYNIYLMARIEEESRRHGPIHGVTVALARTGGIISTCGVIMAGTFVSLMAGFLLGMNQLGFALAFGVLLDTFIVRPVLVPAYLILLHSGKFGALGKFLGADVDRAFVPEARSAAESQRAAGARERKGETRGSTRPANPVAGLRDLG